LRCESGEIRRRTKKTNGLKKYGIELSEKVDLKQNIEYSIEYGTGNELSTSELEVLRPVPLHQRLFLRHPSDPQKHRIGTCLDGPLIVNTKVVRTRASTADSVMQKYRSETQENILAMPRNHQMIGDVEWTFSAPLADIAKQNESAVASVYWETLREGDLVTWLVRMFQFILRC
jgi:hypothetical protein